MTMSVGGRSKRSPVKDSSIQEESHLASASKISSSHQRIEESIRDEVSNYDNEGFDSYAGSAQKPSKHMQNKSAFQKEVQEFDIKMKESENKRKEKVNELLAEMKRYE